MDPLEKKILEDFNRLESKIRARSYKKRFIADLALTFFFLIVMFSCFVGLAYSVDFSAPASQRLSDSFTSFLYGLLASFIMTLSMVVLSIIHGFLWILKRNALQK